MIDEQMGMQPYQQDTRNPKELFDVNDIEGKTELTGEQVMVMARMKALGSLLKSKFDIDVVNDFIDDFLTLQLSKDRGSRREFVNALQSKNDQNMGNFLDKFSLGLNK